MPPACGPYCNTTYLYLPSLSTMSESDNNNRRSAVLLSEELYFYCASESLSEDGLREIIERHNVTPNYHHHPDVGNYYQFFFKACRNRRVTESIIRCLLEYFPAAASTINDNGLVPLHLACVNKNVTPNIVQLLVDAAPDSVGSVHTQGGMPLHNLCGNKQLDDAAALKILKLLIEKHPDAVRHADNKGYLPIHRAACMVQSPEFCRLLIEAYPGSERMSNNIGVLPLHIACRHNAAATVEYLYKLYPNAINLATTDGLYPIHFAMIGLLHRDSPIVAVDIVKLLLEYKSNVALQEVDGQSLLLWAYRKTYDNSNLDAVLEIIKVICDLCPESVRKEDVNGQLPLHHLCKNKCVDETATLRIVKLIIQKNPEAVRHADNKSCLPIHLAAMAQSPEFCRVLIEAYPGSKRMSNNIGLLPLHIACMSNTVPTVEYLYKLYPNSINHTSRGGYPIHAAIFGVKKRKNFSPFDSVDIVKFLLDCDPGVKLKKVGRKSPLHYACHLSYNDSNIEGALEMIKVIYDAYPEGIEDGIASDIQRYHQQIQSFLNGELVYSRQAKNLRQMMTPDDKGQLPLHTALQHNVRLGSIKLLVKGNPSAIRTVDTNFALPLHVACQHHNSANVIQYMVGLDTSILDAIDRKGETALHYACRGAKYENIALLLEEYDAVSVSKRNAHKKLPIDLLWESNAVEDRESIEYTESVFRLLKAYPEMVMNYNLDMKQQGTSDRCSTQNGKKRKLDAV
eukprot:scaffold8881_cov93-Skeletonema_dohrnii-CCMP3373.AAC.1